MLILFWSAVILSSFPLQGTCPFLGRAAKGPQPRDPGQTAGRAGGHTPGLLTDPPSLPCKLLHQGQFGTRGLLRWEGKSSCSDPEGHANKWRWCIKFFTIIVSGLSKN